MPGYQGQTIVWRPNIRTLLSIILSVLLVLAVSPISEVSDEVSEREHQHSRQQNDEHFQEFNRKDEKLKEQINQHCEEILTLLEQLEPLDGLKPTSDANKYKSQQGLQQLRNSLTRFLQQQNSTLSALKTEQAGLESVRRKLIGRFQAIKQELNN